VSIRVGKVYLVGAGPGAPDLLTLRAARILERADIVFHDALVHPATVALAERAEKVPVGKRCGSHSTAQKFISKRLVDAARIHGTVVRLKGGDPMLFGRAHEEIAALSDASVPFEVVPGITAALAAGADLRISLTQRGVARSVTFATPRVGVGERPSGWAASTAAADTSAVYMGAGEAKSIAQAMIEAGKPASTPVAIVFNASLPESRVVFTTLSLLRDYPVHTDSGPALILVGEQFRPRENTAAGVLPQITSEQTSAHG
jgi:uroporphyrin-III C-methyltransferase